MVSIAALSARLPATAIRARASLLAIDYSQTLLKSPDSVLGSLPSTAGTRHPVDKAEISNEALARSRLNQRR